MIPPQTVTKILDTAQIEEVIGEFVTLKKRGANHIACCPFHNEKTPSFSVSPAKGIYKCFGCGNAGNVAKFVMEHESLSYPDALRFLAKRYNIEVAEVKTKEAIEEKQEIDSLHIVNQFALQHYQNNLHQTDEGRSVALSYFTQRGFTLQTIQKFQLGYSLEQYDHLHQSATAKGYQNHYLHKLGLTRNKNGRDYDFFRGRVQFPLFNLSGKVIAFAGRTLKADKKIPKYINSPESQVYHKSKVLYGMNFAKPSIRKKDLCLIVEGYTDVISLHQSGVENTAASSGTSLTKEQIRLIKRYTPNITLLMDGDTAGLQAAIRGIDLILEEDMNVKVVTLPEGQDPDSYIRTQGKERFEDYLKNQAEDFIFFKAHLLLQDTQNDPIKKAARTQDLLQSIAKIPDPIKRTLYLKECSRLLDIDLQLLIEQSNQITRKQIQKHTGPKNQEQSPKKTAFVLQEREIVRVLLAFGEQELEAGVPAAAYIISEIEELKIEGSVYREITELYRQHLEEGRILDAKYFITHADDKISRTAVSLLYGEEVSQNWEKKHQVFTSPSSTRFKTDVYSAVDAFKMSCVNKLMQECLEALESSNDDTEAKELQETYMTVLQWQREIAVQRGTVIVR